MANPLIFYVQLQIIQAALAGLPLQQCDTTNRPVIASLSGLRGINDSTSDVGSEQDDTHHHLIFDESARATSTASVPHEATKGRTYRFFIRGHGGARTGTVADILRADGMTKIYPQLYLRPSTSRSQGTTNIQAIAPYQYKNNVFKYSFF
ncbi:uncharacterized protein ISCGN_014758 [Ixodes scapularis]